MQTKCNKIEGETLPTVPGAAIIAAKPIFWSSIYSDADGCAKAYRISQLRFDEQGKACRNLAQTRSGWFAPESGGIGMQYRSRYHLYRKIIPVLPCRRYGVALNSSIVTCLYNFIRHKLLEVILFPKETSRSQTTDLYSPWQSQLHSFCRRLIDSWC